MSEEPLWGDFSSKRTWKFYVSIMAILMIVATGIGAIGHISGVGWFGYRQILYGVGELYVLNLNDNRHFIAIDGGEPQLVEAQNAYIGELVGGQSKVTIFNEDNQPIGSYELEVKNSHALINISEQSCLAVVDITPFYGGQKSDKLNFIKLLDAQTRVYIPQTYDVVWPRKSFPSMLSGKGDKGVWIEIVGCPLLEEPEFLDAYLSIRLQERMKRDR